MTPTVPEKATTPADQPAEEVKAKTVRDISTADIHPTETGAKEGLSSTGNRTEALLEEILRQLRASRRESLFDEFSFWKFLSGVLQVVVVFCLLLSLYFLLGQTPPKMEAVHLSVQYAMVVQLMVVAFFLMRDRK